MADEMVAMQLRMSADLRSFQKSMDAMRATADRRLTEVEKRALMADRRLSRTMDQAGRNMTASLKNSLAGVAPVIAGAFSAAAVLKYADAYTSLQNRLKAAGLEGDALRRVEDSLFASANRNGVAVEATAELYQRAAMARRNLGASEEQLLALVSGTSAALKLQGTSAGEASGALLQLGQILGGQKVQAEEYNSLIDQLPVLLQAAADGSSRFGGQIGTLTALVKDGKVSTQEFFAAVLKGLGDVETRAAAATPTVGAAFQTLNNEIGRFVGQTDSGLSATQRMAQGIVFLSDNLDTVTLVVGALATVMGTRYVLALTAGSGAMIANGIAAARLAAFQTAMTASLTGQTTATVVATGATRAFTAAIVANPVGAALVAVTALAAGLYFLGRRYDEAAIAAQANAKATADAVPATSALEALVRDLAGANDEETASIRRKIAALIDEQRLKAQMARNAYLDAKAAARQVPVTASEPTLSIGAMPSGFSLTPSASQGGGTVIGPNGNPIDTVRDTAELRRLRAEAEAAEASVGRLQDTAAQATMVAPAPPPAAPAKTRTGASGPTPEELARQRELLNLQGQVELLRAQGESLSSDGREAEALALRVQADAKQDQIDLLNLTKQYEDAGFNGAEAKARTQIAALAAAREEALAREESRRQAEGEARAIEMTRGFVLDMLDVQEALALTERDSLAVRREILRVRQAERRAALEAAAADKTATAAERDAAASALARLPQLENGENRALDGSSEGARDAQAIVADIRAPENAVERAAEAYAEIDRLRQEDVISEQEAAMAKSQIDAQLMESRLGFASEFFGNLATLQNSSNKKLAALGKAAAIAQATIDGYLAVQKTLAAYPAPFNFVMAASVAAATAANVASIAGMADGGLVTGSGGPREDNQLRWLSTGEFVNNAASVRKNRPFLEAANNGADLSKLIPGLARGGLVGRVSAAAGSVTSARSSMSTSSFAYSPHVDARGADGPAIRRLERVMEEQRRRFADDINGVRDRRSRYKLGGRNR